MKKAILLIFILCGIIKIPIYAQLEGNITPNGSFDYLYDRFGNKYNIDELRIGKTDPKPKGIELNNVVIPSYLLCTAGYFNVYFESGSGFELVGNSTHIARRNVICQLFTDLSNFIVPVNSGVKVNIWVRNIGNIVNYPMHTGVLGLATSFYTVPSVSPTSGIADGEIWKTINSGADGYTNMASPLMVQGGSSTGAFYHGMMAFNFVNSGVTWHTDLTTPTSSSDFDLYSVALHEITHALGFCTLIAPNGNSVFGSGFKYYSRYDLFLKDQSSQNLIVGSNPACSMYDYDFNPGLSTSVLSPNPSSCTPDNTTCVTAIQFAGTVNQAVYTPNCFEGGSSLSHLEDQCHSPSPYANNQYYCMANAGGQGSTYMHRYLQPEERSVLCDLGYKVNTTYGNSLYTANNYNYGGSQCGGLDVAGVNDGINTGGAYTWTTTPGNFVNIMGSGLLGNDYNADEFECLEVMNGVGTVSVTAGTSATSITFTAGTATGVALLRYVPVNTTSGNRGNITYAYVYINSTNCTASACNMILNEGFEFGLNCGEAITPDRARINCWEPLVGSPDYFVRRCTPTINPDVTIPTGISVCNPASDSWSGSGNNAFLGLVNFAGALEEAEQSLLATAIQPNVSYTLSFWAKSALSVNYSGENRLVFRGNAGTLAPVAPGSFMSAGLYLTEMNVHADGEWRYYTLEFTYAGSTPLNNLMIGNMGNNSGGDSYVFIDDITLAPTANHVRFEPPQALCQGITTIDDLSAFVFPAPVAGATFSGPGVTLSGGVYSFAASSHGWYTIFYHYTNNLGCTVTQPAKFRVTPAMQPNVFITSNPSPAWVCPGVPVTLYGNGGMTYEWYSPFWTGATIPCTGNCTSIVVTPPVSQLFVVIGTDSIGCSDTAEFGVIIEPCTPGGGGTPKTQLFAMPDDVKHYTTRMVPGTNDHSIMVGTIFRTAAGGANTIHFLYLDNQGNILVSNEYTSSHPDERAIDVQGYRDASGFLKWYVLCQVSGKIKILVLSSNGTLLNQREYEDQNGMKLFPMSSVLWSDNVADNRLYICGYKTPASNPNYTSQKEVFVMSIDIDWATLTYLDPIISAAYDWGGGANDYDMATRMSLIKTGLAAGQLWITGSINGVSGRSAVLNLTVDPLTLTAMNDNPFLIDMGWDNTDGPWEYGIDLMEVNGHYYLLGNSTYPPATNPTDMIPREFRIWWIQDLGTSLSAGTRYQYWNEWSHWAAHAISTGGSMFTIATLIEGQYSSCIPLPYTPAVDNVQVNLVTVDVSTFKTWTIGPNKLYMTSSGTGDPATMVNAFYNLGGALSLIDYPPVFAAVGVNQYCVNAPKFQNGKLGIKYMSPDLSTLSIPCGVWDCNQLSCIHGPNTVHGYGSYMIVWNTNIIPGVIRTDLPLVVALSSSPATSVEGPYDLPDPFECVDQPGNHNYRQIQPRKLPETCIIYPNPATTSITLELGKDMPAGMPAKVYLLDITGRSIAELYSGNITGKQEIKLPAVATGLYFVEVVSGEKVILKEKLMINK